MGTKDAPFHSHCSGHTEKQETEMKQKLEKETGNRNWKWKWEQKDAPITGAMLSS